MWERFLLRTRPNPMNWSRTPRRHVQYYKRYHVSPLVGSQFGSDYQNEVAPSAAQVVLYDIPSRAPCRAWSPNTWKTRLLLNFKNVKYRTEWIEYPALKAALTGLVPPNQMEPAYTVPTMKLRDGGHRMGSRTIANEICHQYLMPAITIDTYELATLDEIMPKLYHAIAGAYIPLVPERILNDTSRDYWYKTREVRFGMPLSKLLQEHGGARAWLNAKPYLHEVTRMLEHDQGGPFFRGNRISYVDFQWGGFLLYMQRIGPDIFGQLLDTAGGGGVHNDLLAALAFLSARDT